MVKLFFVQALANKNGFSTTNREVRIEKETPKQFCLGEGERECLSRRIVNASDLNIIQPGTVNSPEEVSYAAFCFEPDRARFLEQCVVRVIADVKRFHEGIIHMVDGLKTANLWPKE